MDITTKRIHNGNEFENELSVRNLPTNELSSSRWLFLIFFSTTNDNEQIFSQLFALTERVELPAVRTREGTFPPNSQWAKSPIEYNGHRNSASHIFDYVEVPVDLVSGQYVLSFRWDCQATPQIWNACANINII